MRAKRIHAPETRMGVHLLHAKEVEVDGSVGGDAGDSFKLLARLLTLGLTTDLQAGPGDTRSLGGRLRR